MDSSIVDQYLVLATGRISSLSQGFSAHSNSRSSNSNTIMLIAICLVAVVAAIGIHFYVRHRMRRPLNSRSRLFRELSRANNLTWSQRRLLKRLAAVKNVADPTLMFINPQLWTLEPSSAAAFCKPRILRRMKTMQRSVFSPILNEDAAVSS